MTDKTNLGELWFYVRWATGWALDILITMGGALAMYWMFFFYSTHPITGVPVLPDTWMASPPLAFAVAVGVFAAFMSGRQWVRTQYFTHILPEVWADTVASFIKKAKEEHKDE